MKTYQNFLAGNFHVLVAKFLVYLNRQVFVMIDIPVFNANSVGPDQTQQHFGGFQTKMG